MICYTGLNMSLNVLQPNIYNKSIRKRVLLFFCERMMKMPDALEAAYDAANRENKEDKDNG